MKKLGIVLMLLCFACDSDSVGPVNNSGFGIYLLRDRTLTLFQIENKNINELELGDKPLISTVDISMYDYSSHCIYLNRARADFINSEEINWNGQPFVICANYKRCYIGNFHGAHLQWIGKTPYIDELNFHPQDVLYISGSTIDGIDERNNSDVKKGLIEAGILHSGLTFMLQNIEVIENTDTATIKYAYKIENNDTDNLYVLDPDKMGSSLFHYFTNGINFWQNNNYYFSQYKTAAQPEPWDSWQPEWFTKINTGEMIERIVTLKGYPHLPPGSYKCSMNFNNPINIEKADRILSDGRYWLGQIVSPDFEMTIE